MAEFFYPRFLTDPAEYDKAAAFWSSRWEQLLAWAGQLGAWEHPWANTTFADGTPCRDGNPIFSSICPERRLAVRVIQQEPGNDPKELNFWTDTFAKGDPLATRELVVSCVLTPETFNSVSDLIAQWITKEEVETRRVGYYPTSTGRLPSRGNSPEFPTSSRRSRARKLELAGVS